MATSAEYAAFVCDRVAEYGTARSRKMFGEYMVYLHEKPILLLCDNTVFVKKIPALFSVLQGAECDIPYPGAKEQSPKDKPRGGLH